MNVRKYLKPPEEPAPDPAANDPQNLITNIEPEPTAIQQQKNSFIVGGLTSVLVVFVAFLALRSSALTNQFVPAEIGQGTATRSGSATPQDNSAAAGGSFIRFIGAEARGHYYISPATASVANGQNITVDVRIDPEGASVGFVENVTVAYDPAKLQYVSHDVSGTPFSAELVMNTATPGTIIRSSYQPADGYTSTDTLVMKVTFRALTGNGTASVSVSGIAYDNNAADIRPTGDSATLSLTGGTGGGGTASGKRCRIELHGKGGGGSGTFPSGDVTVISPNGNAPGWGGLQWLYFPESGYAEIVSGNNPGLVNLVNTNQCGQVIVYGFSNGAAMAAKLYCRGETFGGKLVGVMVDDPVPDHGVDNCARPAGVALKVYHSQQLADIVNSRNPCQSDDWTCEGGSTYSTAQYGSLIGQQGQIEMGTHIPAGSGPGIMSGWWK